MAKNTSNQRKIRLAKKKKQRYYLIDQKTVNKGDKFGDSARIVRVKKKLVLLIKRHILLVFLLSLLTIAIHLYLQCLQYPQTCIAAFLTSKDHNFTKRSSEQVKYPWDYFFQMKEKNKKSFLSSLMLSHGLLRFLKNSSYATNKQSDIINSSIIMATPPSINKKDGSKNTTPVLEQKELDLANNSMMGSKQLQFDNSTIIHNIHKIHNSTINLDPKHTQNNRSKIMIIKPGCQSLYPQIVLYNRIFKTGSTTMSQYFKTCSETLDFKFKTDLTEEWSSESISHPIISRIQKHAKYRKQRNKSHQKRTKGLFIVAHFYFRRDLHVPINYTYINLLREPVERYISNYYYARSPLRWAKKLKKLKQLGHFNETLEECLDKQHEGCEWDHMTRFFCGPKTFCKNGSSKALELAKYNMEHYYASVGVLENVEEFIQVLEKRLPGFVLKSPGPLEKKFVTRGVKKRPITDIVMKKIINANIADIELYKFAKRLFKEQAKECGIKIKK